MKQFLKNISPFNNRTEMPTLLFVVKKILAFWLCYIAGLFIAEGAVIILHFALGKNMLVGDVFDPQTITLIMYYGYIVMAGVALLYCGLHSFWNAILYSVLGLNLSGNDETVTAIFNMQSVGKNIWNGGEYGIEASIITTVVLAIAAAIIWYVSRDCVNEYKKVFGASNGFRR